ncbi:phage baseplate assembly protein [Lonepinella sp. BR2271]|uniref:phage baseplate assembly protein n=1 Tax=Lonepinella sp. BR2271 TaxID=3434550 RepID=UPI003F6E3F01
MAMQDSGQDNGYPFNNEIVVEIDGKQHKNWASYDIDSDFLIPADAFSFELGKGSDDNVVADYSGQSALVKINGETVLTGIIDSVQHEISKQGRRLSLSGRDRAGILLDCSAPQVNVKGLTVLAAVKKLVEPLGITQVKLKAESNPTLDKVDIEVGESAWDAIIHCANSAGLHCWFEPEGVLVVGGADYSSPPVATLCCSKNGDRNNFSQASLMFDVSQQFSEVTFLAQRHGRSGDSNKNDLKWVYRDPEVAVYKPKTVVVPDVEDLTALQKWAKKYLSDSQLEGFTLTITVPDHKTQSGVLWVPGQRVHVICEEFGLDGIFFLMGRRFMLSRQGGSQTELRFKQDGVWTPDAYVAKSEKARKRKGKKGKKGKKKLELASLGA